MTHFKDLDSRNMSVSKSLNIRASLVLSMSRRLSSNRAKASLKLFKEVNPNDCKLMLQTKTRRFKDKKEVQVKTILYLSELRRQFFLNDLAVSNCLQLSYRHLDIA